MRKIFALAITLGVSTFGLMSVSVDEAVAAPKPVRYANCTALNKVYRHGVAKSSKAKDKVRGKTKPVTTFVVNAKVYQLNIRLDGDKDGIACEKR
jgi:hypothetical protein